MRTQFYDKVTTDTTHPLHHTLNKALPHRNIKTIPFTHFTNKLDTVPVAPSCTSKATHFYNTLASCSISNFKYISVLGRTTPLVDDSETVSRRTNGVQLSRLRCGHHNSFLSYRKMIHQKIQYLPTMSLEYPHYST